VPLLIRYYRGERVRIGPVALEALKLERVEERKSGDLLDVVTELAERYGSTPEVVVEVVETDQRGEERRVVAYTARQGGVLLFHRPARLQRIVLVDEAAASAQAPQPLERMPSYRPSNELYIMSGEIVVENPKVVAVLVETDKGSRFVPLRIGVKKDSNSSKAGLSG
jgi:hypothetical protein